MPLPSVDVVWKGNSRNPQIRYRLLGYLHRLASLSDGYLRQGEPPFALSLMGEEHAAPSRANVEAIDHDVAGTISISSWISPHPETLVTRAREAGLTVIEPEGEGPHLIVLDRVRLRGIDFKLFDPNGLNSGAGRMSFVFLECPEFHFLDGRLVEIVRSDGKGETESQRRGGIDALRTGNIYLRSPSIHLRSYLEDWTDCLFSWTRYFVVGDFWWQRREEIQGYSDYRGVFEELQTTRGAAHAEEATFDAVLATFSQHAEHRIGETQGFAQAEKV